MKTLKNLLRCTIILSICVLGGISPGISYAQGRCLIISDIHLNPFFTDSSKYQSDSTLLNALSKADVSQWEAILNKKAPHMIDPSIIGHDSNYPVLVSAINNMYSRIPKPDFIVIAGDFIWHNAPNDEALKQKSIQFIAGLFHKKYGKIPIITTYGNNDSGSDYLKQSPQFLANFAKAWDFAARGIDTAAYKNSGGYYSASIGKLKFVVVNTTLVSQGGVERGYDYYNDGYTMLNNWLPAELADTTKNIWIISHIPPGTDGYGGGQLWSSSGPKGNLADVFSQQVVNNSKQIKLMIASHTHMNDFKVFYSGKSTDSASALLHMRIVPSIGMDHYNNPSFEVAEFDASYHLTRETNYYLNLSNLTQPVDPKTVKWDKTLSLNSFVPNKIVNAKTLTGFIGKMIADSQIRPVYDNFYGVGTSPDAFTNPGKFPTYIKAEQQTNNL